MSTKYENVNNGADLELSDLYLAHEGGHIGRVVKWVTGAPNLPDLLSVEVPLGHGESTVMSFALVPPYELHDPSDRPECVSCLSPAG